MRGGGGDYDWPRYQRAGDIAMPGAQDRWDQLAEVNARKQEAPQPHDLPRAADRPERGSLVELRQRLERLPAGHPSSPYNDDLSRKPAVARLKDLELPLQGYERDGNGEAKRFGTEPAEGAAASSIAEPAPEPEPEPEPEAKPSDASIPAETVVSTGSNGRALAPEKVSAADWRTSADRDGTAGWEGAQEADSLAGLAPLPEPDAPAGWTSAPEPDGAAGRTPAPEPDAVSPWTPGPDRPPEPPPPAPEPDPAAGWISAPVSNGAPGLPTAPGPDVTPSWGPEAGRPPEQSPAPAATPSWDREPDRPPQRSLIPEPVAVPSWSPEPVSPAGFAPAPEPVAAAPWAPAPGRPSAPESDAAGWTGPFDPENTGEWRTAPSPENTGEWRTIPPSAVPADLPVVAAPEPAEPTPVAEALHSTAPELKLGPNSDEPRYGSDGSWEWNGRYLTPMQSQIADTALSRYSAAEGKNVFGGYGHSGLTPAMRRIEAQVERGQLLPDTESYALKTADSYKETLADLISRHPDKSAEELSHEVHDGIRYAYIFENEDYSDGTLQIHSRLKSQGFELEARRNSWKNPESKGISSRWRDPAHDLVFEVQFHTASSWDAKQRTQRSYRRITDPSTPPAERVQLRTIQAKTSSVVPVPPGAASIPDYRKDGQ
jgi:hypothetical protein